MLQFVPVFVSPVATPENVPRRSFLRFQLVTRRSRVFATSHLRIAPLMAAVALALPCACAGPGHRTPITEINVARSGKSALRGYDPVAYFRQGHPQKGDNAYPLIWKNATWKFASAANRRAFVSDPSRYEPQYGGYCAFAMSRGRIADADPHCWAVMGDRLYLNNNPFAQKLWDLDRTGGIKSGDRNWDSTPKETVPR